MNRRDFMKRAAYTGVSLLLAEQIMRPLPAFAETGTGSKADSGINYLLDSLHGMIRNIPYHDSRCLDLIKLAGLYAQCGRRQEGLDALSESVDAARAVKEHNRFEYASLLTNVANAYYNIGEESISRDVALEEMEFSGIYSREMSSSVFEDA